MKKKKETKQTSRVSIREKYPRVAKFNDELIALVKKTRGKGFDDPFEEAHFCSRFLHLAVYTQLAPMMGGIPMEKVKQAVLCVVEGAIKDYERFQKEQEEKDAKSN